MKNKSELVEINFDLYKMLHSNLEFLSLEVVLITFNQQVPSSPDTLKIPEFLMNFDIDKMQLDTVCNLVRNFHNKDTNCDNQQKPVHIQKYKSNSSYSRQCSLDK